MPAERQAPARCLRRGAGGSSGRQALLAKHGDSPVWRSVKAEAIPLVEGCRFPLLQGVAGPRRPVFWRRSWVRSRPFAGNVRPGCSTSPMSPPAIRMLWLWKTLAGLACGKKVRK